MSGACKKEKPKKNKWDQTKKEKQRNISGINKQRNYRENFIIGGISKQRKP